VFQKSVLKGQAWPCQTKARIASGFRGCAKAALKGQRFKPCISKPALRAALEAAQKALKGHGFSRAGRAANQRTALAAEGCFSPRNHHHL
jgi:hypothetical protein